MKRFFWTASAAVVMAGAAPSVGYSQIVSLPAVPGTTPVATPAVAAPGPRIGFFRRAKLGMGECLQKILGSPFGELLSNATKPLSTLTGGVIPTLEKKVTAEDTKKPGVAGAAAQGKKDAAEAKERRAAVKYLGTLDCRYYPEASAALAAALRTDPSECVRYEAALALTRGCCCNKVTIDALTASVSGFDGDGNPGERSARVRCTAAVALEKCLSCYVQYGPVEGEDEEECGKKEEKKPVEGEEGGEKSATKVLKKGPFASPTAKQVAKAKEVLGAFTEAFMTAEAMHGTAAATGSRSVFGLFESAISGPATATPVVAAAAYQTPLAAPTPVTTPPARMAEQPVVTAPPPPAVDRVKFQPPPPTTPATIGPVVPVDDRSPAPAFTPAVTTVSETTSDAEAVERLVHKVLLSEAAADQHAAIRQLVKYDWVDHPLVASCLVAGAKSTADAAVRVDCIRHMAHHQMAHKDVFVALAELTADPDTWVREEAAKAAETLKTK